MERKRERGRRERERGGGMNIDAINLNSFKDSIAQHILMHSKESTHN
jgi:hypothetical protein